MLTPEEFNKKFKNEAKQLDEEHDPRRVTGLLLKLSPWLGCEKKHVWNARDEALNADNDVLGALRRDAEIGHLIPEGLVFERPRRGGFKYGDILSLKFRDRRWWKQYMEYVDLYGEAIWVLGMKGSGTWIVHNTGVSPGSRRPSIIIPAQAGGYNDIQVIRLELFLEEKCND